MARKAEIRVLSTHRAFVTKVEDSDGNSVKHNIKCAFNLNWDCGPDCAACEETGSSSKAMCLRDDFQIAYLDD